MLSLMLLEMAMSILGTSMPPDYMKPLMGGCVVP